MVPTHKKLGERMNIAREEFLCELLDYGGKCLDNERPAFQKKFYCDQ